MIKEIMWPVVRPVKSTVHTLWIARHEFYHVLIGLVYAWVLREIWGSFNPRFVLLSVIGSLAMDLDHVFYYFFYGRHDPYSQEVKKFMKRGQIRTLLTFWNSNHKGFTELMFHNIYTIGFLFLVSIISFFVEFETGVVLCGALTLHLIFDIIDDILVLGEVNPNWKRWGRNGR